MLGFNIIIIINKNQKGNSLKCCRQRLQLTLLVQCGMTSFNLSFFSNHIQLQPCLSNYTIPRVVQLKTIVLYCRRNARFLVHTSPPRKFSECAGRFLIRPDWRIESDAPPRSFLGVSKYMKIIKIKSLLKLTPSC